jgi:transposase InsO family protein
MAPWGPEPAIRSDNGSPFASRAVGGLSRLSVWWIKLGILPDRIAPGCPQQNGRHERMHLTLKQETAAPPAGTWRKQQERFDAFRAMYNSVRPHEALGMWQARDKKLSNQAYKSIPVLERAVSEAWLSLIEQPDFLRSLCLFPWIQAAISN